MNSEHSVSECLIEARERIPADEAALLLLHVLDRQHAWLFAHGDAVVAPGAGVRFQALVARRSAGEPVAYLLGRRGFWTLDLAVTPDTLIPRPETELLVEQALARLDPGTPARVADLGTGSGAIALAIASERPLAQVIATDRSDAALAVARGNAATHGLDGRVEFRAGDWFVPVAGERFHLVASNPPYIAEDDPHLGQGDLRHEPHAALASGPDGLDAIRVIVAAAPAHLVAGGWLLLEHGFDQGPAVRALLRARGFDGVATVCDLEGRDRVSLGRRAAV
ncbi:MULTISPECIES: peptide chain release factor N(5)-glutamine methyltransferase [unclassified Luteimonas]